MGQRGKTVFVALVAFALGAGSMHLAHLVHRRAWSRPVNPAMNPFPAHVRTRHMGIMLKAKLPNAALLFLGDSLTEYWQDQPLWAELYAARANNLGIAGDTTAGVLWRIQNGELNGLSPRVVVLMIGTNDLDWGGSVASVVEHVASIVDELHRRLPGVRVLLLGITPRQGSRELAAAIVETNRALAKLADGEAVAFLELGITADPELMPDGLHLSAKGYQVWADAMGSALEKMLRPAETLR